MTLALHPLIESGALPVAPAFLATVAVVLVAASAVPAPRRAPVLRDADGYLREPLSTAGFVGRTVALALLGLVLAAGFFGVNRATQNIAPALLVGVGWPLLVLACAAVPGLWARIDPWDGLARGLESARVAARDTGDPPADVRWAMPLGLAFTWYLSAFRGAVQPRAVGITLAVYAFLTVIGCLALGRRRWLGSAEPVGLLLRWIGLLPRRALAAWQPPPGAALLLGVVGGGLLFGAVRLTRWWSGFGFPRQGLALDTVGVVVCAAAGAAVLATLARQARRFGGEAAVAAAAVPVVTAIILVVSLLGGRAVNAAQLLVVLASDPFGWGWDLFGTAGWRVRPYPFTPGWHVGVQLALLLTGGVTGARIARAHTAAAGSGALVPALLATCVLLAAGVLAVTML